MRALHSDLSPASAGERWELESEGDVQSGPVSSGLPLLLEKSLGINTESFLLAGLKSKFLLTFLSSEVPVFLSSLRNNFYGNK